MLSKLFVNDCWMAGEIGLRQGLSVERCHKEAALLNLMVYQYLKLKISDGFVGT